MIRFVLLLMCTVSVLGQDLLRKESTTFATSGLCSDCHAPGPPNDLALRTPDGTDVSPVTQWRAGLMANSFRDPYFKAKITAEVAEHPTLQALIEDECLTCHAPMGRTEKLLADTSAMYTLAEATQDTLAWDGVSCTVCHQIEPNNLASQDSWNGHYEIINNRLIYGPYDGVDQQPMVTTLAYIALEGLHIRESEMCATCHTLFTPTVDDNSQIVGTFPEQTPYLEWRNSDYAVNGQSCQSCHLPDVGSPITISNFPMGLPSWTPYGQHVATGGNFFMLEMLKNHGSELEVTASEANFDSLIIRTKRFLKEETATVELLQANWSSSDSLTLDLRITNLTGHKFPTAYPSRRAWINLQISDESGSVRFESGAWDPASGEIVNIDSNYEPHYSYINHEAQTQIYEGVIGDVNGAVTHGLLRAASYLKDNRLPPSGFSSSGIFADSTAIAGAAVSDTNFNAIDGIEGSGSDDIRYRIGGLNSTQNYTVYASLVFQPVMPRAVAYLNQFSSPEISQFVGYWDAADKSPLIIDSLSAAINPTGLAGVADILPETSLLVSAYPNPFNPTLNLSIQAPGHGEIGGAVYSLLGQKVYDLQRRIGEEGSLKWTPASEISSGIYLVIVQWKDKNGQQVQRVQRVTYLK